MIIARRDRQCSAGDYLISMPSAMVSAYDLLSIRNAIDVLLSRKRLTVVPDGPVLRFLFDHGVTHIISTHCKLSTISTFTLVTRDGYANTGRHFAWA